MIPVVALYNALVRGLTHAGIEFSIFAEGMDIYLL
jgi:hypothetical protein